MKGLAGQSMHLLVVKQKSITINHRRTSTRETPRLIKNCETVSGGMTLEKLAGFEGEADDEFQVVQKLVFLVK